MKILIDFLSDTFRRLFAKTPAYHNILGIILTVCALITGLPELLAQYDVQLPAVLDHHLSQIVSIASLVAAFVTQLAVKNPDEKNLKI